MTPVTCAVCGAPTAAAFEAVDRNRRLSTDSFHYYRCVRCHTLALVPVPEDLARYYPAEYYRLPRNRAELLATARSDRYKLEIVRRFVPAGRLVEIGPGAGGFAAVMQEAGYDTSAIEMDARACRFLRAVLGITVHESDDPQTALEAEGPFDVVAMWHVIEHLPNPLEVLSSAASALAPGGIIALAAPNPDSLQFRLFGRHWTHLDAPRHLVLIPAETLAEVGRRLGLDVVLLTTRDTGTLGWNVFGWRESLAGFVSAHLLKALLRVAGSAVARAMAAPDQRGHNGSTFTLVLRKPS